MRYFAWVGIVAAGSLVWAAQQESQKTPTPQKEHALLKAFEGEWDGTCTQTPDPNKPAVESKFRETSKMSLGGFWLITEFKGEMEGKTVEGHGVMGYDPLKRKYVTTWVDSMWPHLFVAEGDADASGKRLTFMGEMIDPATQKPVKEKLVFDLGESDARTLVFYKIGSDGKETKAGEVRYTRCK